MVYVCRIGFLTLRGWLPTVMSFLVISCDTQKFISTFAFFLTFFYKNILCSTYVLIYYNNAIVLFWLYTQKQKIFLKETFIDRLKFLLNVCKKHSHYLDQEIREYKYQRLFQQIWHTNYLLEKTERIPQIYYGK